MTINKGLFSSKKPDWETPHEFFKKVDEEFGFDIDVCSDGRNNKVENYFTPSDDALTKDWHGTCWMNPPYGREIKRWVEKAYKESVKNGSTIVCLLPARTDTRWFHDWVYGKAEIRFIKGRLKFVGAANSAPFPSMLAIYRGETK